MVYRLLVGGAAAAWAFVGSTRLSANEETTFFELQVRPILADRCLKCHGASKQEGGLRLDSRKALLSGGDSGPAVELGESDDSLLISAVRYEGPEMPPAGPLSDSQVAALTRWIDEGAEWPEHDATIRAAASGVAEADRRWWAFRPLQKPAPPSVENDDWSTNALDQFVLERLRASGLSPAPRADRRTLIRRLYFDLLGLPPTPAEVDAFVADGAPDAWPRLVDRLLEDARYGEHWARFWLDLVRYAESDGWNQDAFRPHLWRYRDYVVDAFNDDKPYPRFVLEQLAGDELPGDDPTPRAAAGFLRLGIYEYNQRDARSHWNDVVNEMTDVAGDVFLGLGMACARCHDHKFDPILQTDYFALRAFFEPVVWRDDLVAATDAEREAHQVQLAVWEAATADVRGRIDALVQPYHERKWATTVDKFPLDIQACFHTPVAERTSWEHQMAYLVERQFEEEAGGPLANLSKEDREALDALEQELAEFDSLKPPALPPLMTATDFDGELSPTFVPGADGEPIAPAFPTVLSSEGGEAAECRAGPHSSGRRTALAEWIGRDDNPLTTRVIVNRLWRRHFGRGLAPAANDFGRLGGEPSHGELLDFVASTFVEQGWSFKRIHRLILTSSTWRQSTEHPQAAEFAAIDPADELYWRAPIRRLSAEQLRDALLSVSGELDGALGGPSVEADSPRRGLYVKRLRNSPDEFLSAFDAAAGLKSVAERDATTTPTQSLLMVNGDYVLARARALAERLQGDSLGSPSERLRRAFDLAWGRDPTDDEFGAALDFVGAADGEDPPPLDSERLIDFCHVLLNSNEFLYLD